MSIIPSPEDPHWTEIELVPLRVCPRGLEKARRFPTPQAAWDAWDDPNEMLWILKKCGYHDFRFMPCALRLVAPALKILDEKMPKTQLFLQAVEAVRLWGKWPDEENKILVGSFLPRMKGALEGKHVPYHAAYCVYKLARCVHDKSAFAELSMDIAFALYYTAKHRRQRLLPGIPNVELSLERIAVYQCGIVRRHFRYAPTFRVRFEP